MFIYKIFSFEDKRGDLIRFSAKPPTYGEPDGMGITIGPTWDAVLLDGMLTIEGVNSEDVVDGVTHGAPDARLLVDSRDACPEPGRGRAGVTRS
jgi:hypothetical protein